MLKKGIIGGALAGLLTFGGFAQSDEKISILEQKIQTFELSDSSKTITHEDSLKNETDSIIKSACKNYSGLPLEKLAEAYNSVYQIKNVAFYEYGGSVGKMWGVRGSGILLEGGYFLTAAHIVDVDFPGNANDVRIYEKGFIFGKKGYANAEVIRPNKEIPRNKGPRFHHNELTIVDHNSHEVEYQVEEIILSKNHDYALLKLKGEDKFLNWIGRNLTPWNKGINIPDEVKLGMESFAMGYSLGRPNSLRVGNISEIRGELCGKEYYGIKNDILPGDSGGPIFVIENGEVKIAAMASAMYVMRDFFINHPTNLGCALRMDIVFEEINGIQEIDCIQPQKKEEKKE